uniref:CRAL-TRIO domain-containing protein n=1 Tax=Odontella aurita TaxID=265563 RepID=A0A7S4ILK2_9STRA|mmetsp:Transcript_26845/g.79350  ORF Transcript_26845/g.79350 Transcript_26845/m.79350 type:complete len:578 (+) Transcript_26845:129-1862(+)
MVQPEAKDGSTSVRKLSSFSRLGSLLCWRKQRSKSNDEPTRDIPGSPEGITGKQQSAPDTQGKRMDNGKDGSVSVYHDALESHALGELELAYLKEFCDAHSSTNSKSIYHDAADYESSPLYPYAPAMDANRHPPETAIVDKPDTLLGSNENISVDDEKRWKSAKLQNTLVVKEGLDKPRVNYNDRGYPGELTDVELDACLRFRSELNRRKTDGESRYREMVDALHGIEEESYALCRFLRARKFDVDAVFEMMSESLDVWREASEHNFYPEPDEAIGAPMSVLLTQYPILYSGVAKNGSGVNYFRCGQVKVEGIDCVTNFENLVNMVWHNAMHKFPSEIAKVQARDPDGARVETLAVFDCEGLAASGFNSRTYEVLKAAVKVNVCFPEILNSMVVINAPSFFSFFWRIIKGMLDPRTASKISIFADRKKGRQWLLDNVEESELLSDYGGSGPSFDEVMQSQGKGGIAGTRRRLVELINVYGSKDREVKFELKEDELMIALQVYTRSASGADVSLFRADELVKKSEVKKPAKNVTDSTDAYSADIASDVRGPGDFRLVLRSKGSGKKDLDHFLLVGLIS